MIFLDLETTGLGCDNDEILQVSIINSEKEILLNTLVKPTKKREWAEAERIHKITPNMVQNSPIISDILPKIIEIIKGEEVVIYNAQFDTKFLPIYENAKKVHCCMLLFAEHYGEWSDWFGSYKWQKLSFAAQHTLFEKRGDFHNALHDCFATLHVWEYLHNPSKQEYVKKYHAEKKEREEIEKAIKKILREERWEKEGKFSNALNNWENIYFKNNPYIRKENNFYVDNWRLQFKDYYSYSQWLEMYFYFLDNGLPIFTKNIKTEEIITEKSGYISCDSLKKRVEKQGYKFNPEPLNKYYFVEKNMYSQTFLMYNLREVEQKKETIMIEKKSKKK